MAILTIILYEEQPEKVYIEKSEAGESILLHTAFLLQTVTRFVKQSKKSGAHYIIPRIDDLNKLKTENF